MGFFKRFMQKLNDVKTISYVCKRAEVIAKKSGEKKPGEEHFLLAAYDLPDGTVKHVFDQLNIEREQIKQAMQQQYQTALTAAGISVEETSDQEIDDAEIKQNIPYQTKPSAQQMMKTLAEIAKKDKERPLLGVHILKVLAEKEYGVAYRTLLELGLDENKLHELIEKELDRYLP